MTTLGFTSLFRAHRRLRSSARAPEARAALQTATQWSDGRRSMRLERRDIARMLGMTGLLTSVLFILSIVIPS